MFTKLILSRGDDCVVLTANTKSIGGSNLWSNEHVIRDTVHLFELIEDYMIDAQQDLELDFNREALQDLKRDK